MGVIIFLSYMLLTCCCLWWSNNFTVSQVFSLETKESRLHFGCLLPSISVRATFHCGCHFTLYGPRAALLQTFISFLSAAFHIVLHNPKYESCSISWASLYCLKISNSGQKWRGEGWDADQRNLEKNREEMAREDETWGEFRWLALDRHKWCKLVCAYASQRAEREQRCSWCGLTPKTHKRLTMMIFHFLDCLCYFSKFKCSSNLLFLFVRPLTWLIAIKKVWELHQLHWIGH